MEEELSEMTKAVERERTELVPAVEEHPALIACRKAAEMVRKVHERHSAEGETLAQHLEQIGEKFLELCKEAANQIRQQHILPKEMAGKMADELVDIGQKEAKRQAIVSRGLTAARDAILGIDNSKPPSK